MNTTTHTNRYGEKIVFDTLDDRTVKMSGYEPDFLRYGYDSKGINMVDPSGGPYITLGMTVNGQKIVSIRVETDHVILTVI